MSKQVTIRGLTYTIPVQGDDPGWGEDTTAFFDAVVEALALLTGTGDIPETSFTIVDGGSGNITNLTIDGATSSAVIIDYSIVQDSVASATESGTIYAYFDDQSNEWVFSRSAQGDASVDINVTTTTNIGQFTYSAGTIGINRTMHFKARTLSQ